MVDQYSYPKEKIRVLFLEGVHQASLSEMTGSGYSSVEMVTKAYTEPELVREIADVHLLGIRSKTRVTKSVLEGANNLLAVGCFCIGTDQVDLDAAAAAGVPVFNAPFSNTRSVAELTIAEVVMLARKACERSRELHSGRWTKAADGCYEVRNKTIGIIGYGHIGPQVGLLAEAFGMRVVYYDVSTKLPLGTAQPMPNLDSVLQCADFVTLHVPDTPATRNMIGSREIALMKKGSYLLNLSRGRVVDIVALRDALVSGHIAGAAADVFPKEPNSNEEEFVSELRGLPNVILTPHIGGSTLEAQRNIGIEVVTALLRYLETGSTSGAVNFPNIELPVVSACHRVLNIHKNVPGVLSQINSIVAETGANISAQYLGTSRDIGYLIMDVEQDISREVKKRIESLSANIRTRLVF